MAGMARCIAHVVALHSLGAALGWSWEREYWLLKLGEKLRLLKVLLYILASFLKLNINVHKFVPVKSHGKQVYSSLFHFLRFPIVKEQSINLY